VFKRVATPTGFEPVRAEPTHLAGERLNHSAKASLYIGSGARSLVRKQLTVAQLVERGTVNALSSGYP
jgi:hypothetical protein